MDLQFSEIEFAHQTLRSLNVNRSIVKNRVIFYQIFSGALAFSIPKIEIFYFQVPQKLIL